MCQFLNDGLYNYSCGKVSDVQWTVKRTNPYIFSITYNDGDAKKCDYGFGEGIRYVHHLTIILIPISSCNNHIQLF